MARSPSTRLFAARHREAAETRAAILRAAERVFASAGYGSARTDAIADAARVNKALLYYYFRGKEELYCAVLEDQFRAITRHMDDALAGGGSAQEKLLRYVSVHFDFIAARPYYPQMVQRLAMTGGRPLEIMARRHIAPTYRKLTRVVGEGIRNGELRDVDPHHTVLSLVALVVFYFSSAPVLKAAMHTDPYTPAHLAKRKKEVMEFIRRGLFRKGKEL